MSDSDQVQHIEAPSIEDVKAVHRQFVTGVTIVTVMDQDEPRGLAVNAFMSLSMDPPQVMVAVQRTSSTYASLFASDDLAVNIVSDTQTDVLNRFSSKGIDKFEGAPWHRGSHGAPLIDGSSARMQVRIQERIQASSHTVFIGLVLTAESFETPPLVYADGRFASASLLQQE